MSRSETAALADALRRHPAIRSKLAIAGSARMLGLGQADTGRPGDDAAILPRADSGFDLLAGEGFIPRFVEDDPGFAGWCGVMVNISDIAAMGGRAIALVDQVWAPDPVTARPLLEGLRDAAAAYGVPVVGGHTNFSATGLGLAVSVFGRAEALITSFGAAPGDVLIAAADHRGSYRNFDNFFAAGHAPAERLRGDLELLPALAEEGLVTAGKDISQGGLAGTALMLAESSGVGIDLDLEAIPRPDGVPLGRWLHSFPSFGFLLTTAPEQAAMVCARFRDRELSASVVGRVRDGTQVRFQAGDERALFWDHGAEAYLGLGPREACHA